jgi:hypothetical protein
MTIDDAELARLRALCEAATPGPWSKGDGKNNARWVVMGHYVPICSTELSHAPIGQGQESNVEFIAASRTALPQLLDEVERLRGLLEETLPFLTHAHWCQALRDGVETVCSCRAGKVRHRVGSALAPSEEP